MKASFLSSSFFFLQSIYSNPQQGAYMYVLCRFSVLLVSCIVQLAKAGLSYLFLMDKIIT